MLLQKCYDRVASTQMYWPRIVTARRNQRHNRRTLRMPITHLTSAPPWEGSQGAVLSRSGHDGRFALLYKISVDFSLPGNKWTKARHCENGKESFKTCTTERERKTATTCNQVTYPPKIDFWSSSTHMKTNMDSTEQNTKELNPPPAYAEQRAAAPKNQSHATSSSWDASGFAFAPNTNTMDPASMPSDRAEAARMKSAAVMAALREGGDADAIMGKQQQKGTQGILPLGWLRRKMMKKGEGEVVR